MIILSTQILDFIEAHENDNVHTLALQSKRYPDIDMPLAIRQIAGRQIAKEKIPLWYSNRLLVYPKHLSLEQCSSEPTARYKASLHNGDSLVDLTGGMGVDFYFLSAQFKHATYLEQQPELVDIAVHNFKTLGLQHISTVQADATTYLQQMDNVDMIYIDPARRSEAGRKTVLIEDCTPNITEIEDWLEQKAELTMIKLSPMLDISLAIRSLRKISDVYIISVNNECKELVFLKKKNAERLKLHCVHILNDRTDTFSFTKEEEEEADIPHVSVLGKYIYEPNASILKAGGYKSITKKFAVKKLHPSSHLYTSDILHSDFHGRKFVIENILTLNKKDLKELITNTKQANITTRNFPLSTQELRKKTGLKEGGDTYIFATTLADEKKVLIVCKKA